MRREVQGKKGGDADEAEVESRSVETTERKKQKAGGGGGGGDGASIELVRRPRGRPPGSKNKPKPPVVVNREAENSAAIMRAHVLEISAGNEVVNALSGFCRRRILSLSVIAAMGAVSNVKFRQPDVSLSPATVGGDEGLMLPGRFEILSMSGSFLRPAFKGNLSITLAGPQGQVVGGMVVGPLVAARTVTVIAAAFANPSFSVIPEEEEEEGVSGDGGGGGRRGGRSEDVEEHQQQHQRAYHAHQGGGGAPATYTCHLPSDVIWPAPPGRTTHRPPF